MFLLINTCIIEKKAVILRKICEDMIKIKRKAFTGNAITEEVTRNFTVEPYELCDDIVRNQIEIGSNSPKYSCVLYDRDTKQVYGYILVHKAEIKCPGLAFADRDVLEFIIQSNGFEITQIVTDKRIEGKSILYLINHVQDTCCDGNFYSSNKYIWYYIYGEFQFASTAQTEIFKGLDFNNLSKSLYLHTIYGEEE